MANQTLQLAELLRGAGATVEVIRVNPPYRPAWVGRLRGIRAIFRLVPFLRRLWRLVGRAQLVHVMANSGFAWHLCAAPAVWTAFWRGIPVLVNYRGGEADEFLARASAWVLPTLRRAAVLAVPSRYLQDVFGKYGVASIILPNIIDLATFAPAPKLGPAPSPHIIVARNLEPIYDIPTALRAFARIREQFPQARLSVAGSGPELGRLGALAGELGVAGSVNFTGPLDHRAMADLYRSAHLMLNPSRVDNMPNSILEALASGVPIVSTRVGGVPHLVRDGETALLVDAGDDTAMAAAALRVLGAPGVAERLVSAGLADVQQYGWPRVRETLRRAYVSALRENPGGLKAVP
jgi:glycosyltransferase involved in cell wall biosynthesis